MEMAHGKQLQSEWAELPAFDPEAAAFGFYQVLSGWDRPVASGVNGRHPLLALLRCVTRKRSLASTRSERSGG